MRSSSGAGEGEVGAEELLDDRAVTGLVGAVVIPDQVRDGRCHLAFLSTVRFRLISFCNQLQTNTGGNVAQVETRRDHRSGCPINLSLEVIGDSWSLVIIRDLVYGNARHFRELLRSEEGISSSILADRLKKLVAQGSSRPRTTPPTSRRPSTR